METVKAIVYVIDINDTVFASEAEARGVTLKLLYHDPYGNPVYDCEGRALQDTQWQCELKENGIEVSVYPA